MPPCTPCTKPERVCNNDHPCDQCHQLGITCFYGRKPGKTDEKLRIQRSNDDDLLRSKRLDPLDYSGISSAARVKLMNRLKKEDEAELKCGKIERERQKPLVWDRTCEVLKQQACVKAWMKPLQDHFSNSSDNKHTVWLCCHPKLIYEMFQLKKKKQTPKFSGIGYTEDAAVSRQVMAVEMDRRSKATRSFGKSWGILLELRLSDEGRDFWHQQVQQQPFFDGVLHNVVSGKKRGLTAQGLIWALEFYESRSKLRFPELPSDFDEPSYYIGDLKDDISDDADAMDVDEAETAGPSVLNVRQPRIRSLDDNSIEGDTLQHTYEVTDSDDELPVKGAHTRYFIGYPGRHGPAKGVTGDEEFFDSIRSLQNSSDGQGQWHIIRTENVDEGSVQRLNAKYHIGNEIESTTTPELQEAFNLWQNPMTAFLVTHDNGIGYVEGIQGRQPPFYEEKFRYLESTHGTRWKVTRVFDPVNTLKEQHLQRETYGLMDGGPLWAYFGLYRSQITKKLTRQLNNYEAINGKLTWERTRAFAPGIPHSHHQQIAPSDAPSSSKAKGKQRAMSREARERAETSPMETGSEDASSTQSEEARERAETSPMETGSEDASSAQSEGGWIVEVSVDEDVIGVTEDQDVVTELLGFMDSDVGRSRWSIQNFAFDIEGETLRKKYGVAQGDRTSKAVMDALALWKRPFHATSCIFPNRPDGNSARYGYSELDNLADHVAFIEACEHLAYVEGEPKGWALLWCLPLMTQKERARARTQARKEALEKLGRINWDENADDPSKPIICMDLHKSIQDWERVHEKIDMQRCQEFNDRFGHVTAENLSLWRRGTSALDATKKYPLYLITYPGDEDQLQKEGITDDPFLRDKVRYIRKHWDEKNWKISRTLVDNREQALQRIDKVDGGKWEATLPYYCTQDLWRAITDIEIEKLDLGNKVTRDMIENMEYSESGDQGEGDDDDNGDSGA